MKSMKVYLLLGLALVLITAPSITAVFAPMNATIVVAAICAPFAFFLPKIVIKAMFDEFKAAPEEKSKGESPRPDVVATRQWVSEILDANTSNCIRIGGDTHKGLLHRIERLESDAKTDDMHQRDRDGVVVVMGFGYGGEGDQYEFFSNGGKKYKTQTKDALGNHIKAANKESIEIGKEEYDSAWQDFAYFWEGHNCYPYEYLMYVKKPEGFVPEVGTTIGSDTAQAWKEACYIGQGKYGTLMVTPLCGGVYQLERDGHGKTYVHYPTLLAKESEKA